MNFPKTLSLAAILLACNAVAGFYASAAVAATLEAFPASTSTTSADAPAGTAPLVHEPDPSPRTAAGNPPPTQPLHEPEGDDEGVDLSEKLGPVTAGALGVVMLAGLGLLFLKGCVTYQPDVDADSTWGLRPER